MTIYLLRHGIAEDQNSSGKDSDRELTEDGRKELKRTLKVAANADVKPALILTSPYVRACDTAALAKKALGTKEDLLETKTLVPDGKPQLVWAEMCDHRKEKSLMLVSHNPLIEQLVCFLLDTPTLRFDFKKGVIVALELENFRGQPDGVLRWVLSPEFC